MRSDNIAKNAGARVFDMMLKNWVIRCLTTRERLNIIMNQTLVRAVIGTTRLNLKNTYRRKSKLCL